MSNPFVYTPPSRTVPLAPPSPHMSPHLPFIPSPTLLPLASPLPPTPRRVRFDDDLEPDDGPRPRRPSWHGPAPAFAPASLHHDSGSASFLAPPPSPTAVSQRRHSFGASQQTQPGWVNNLFPFSTQPTDIALNPLLDAHRPRPDFHFSLSLPSFRPLRLFPSVSPFSPSHSALSSTDLAIPASHPPLSAFYIVHPDLPHWPIHIRSPSPTVGDVLRLVHRALQTPISHGEWSRFAVSRGKEASVARAYSRRCKGVASDEDRVRGVKRIDFMSVWDQPGRREVLFRGLIKDVAGETDQWSLVVD